MSDQFFTQPILNSPYEIPSRHWELDPDGQPTSRIMEFRRDAMFITPVPKPRKHRSRRQQGDEYQQVEMPLSVKGITTTTDQQYDTTSMVNPIRKRVDKWRMILNPADWRGKHDQQCQTRFWI